MKVKVKNVYYCDFCKKRGLRSNAMASHEIICTLNPNRKCGLCGFNGVRTLEQDDESECPICHFVRLRQTAWTETSFYDLGKALKEYWSTKDVPYWEGD